MSEKKLTITFPLYGQHDMVARAFTALKEQTWQDFSVLCLDDQSPQNFEALAETFRPHFPITLQYNQTNLGAMKNIWQSIQVSVTSPYLLSHHADDYLKADYLKRAIDILDNNPDVSFVLTGPIWVDGNHPYEKVLLGDTPVDYFDAADFARNIINFAPYIFGSVVYRRKHLVHDWQYEAMDTYCDRYFLGEILRTHSSRGAYIHGFGIIEHDHSKDSVDNRSPKLHEDHAINLLAYYRYLLADKYLPDTVDTIITNATLYYFGNFKARSSLWQFYQKQKPHKLITISKIRLFGLYALIVLPLSLKQKHFLLRQIKRLKSIIRAN